jgi:ABC-2 type transport system permease protein
METNFRCIQPKGAATMGSTMESTLRATFVQARAHGAALRHRVKHGMREGRLMTTTIVAFMTLYMVAAYVLVNQGLRYVHKLPLLGPLLTERMLFLLFFFFFLMLVISNSAITGISLFRRQETGWHLSLPMPHSSIVLWRTVEGLLLSSWGLLLLSAPILVAFGNVLGGTTSFYVMSILSVIALISVASNISSWLLLFIVRCYRPWWLKAAGVLGVLLVIVISWQIRQQQGARLISSDVAANVNQLLRHTRICTHPLLPSSWVAEVVISSGRGLYDRSWFYLLTLTSYALVVWLLTRWLAGRFFYDTWNISMARMEGRLLAKGQQVFGTRSHRGLRMLLSGLKRQTQALVMKDVRIFLREPMQWGQCALIFGLLLVYTSNLRHLSYNYKDPLWSSITSYLNLTVCCLAMSTLSTRFVFPQFSLEGQRLWILGLAPFPLTKVLSQKLILNVAVVTPVTTLLVMISSFSLKLSMERSAFFVMAIVLQTIGLNTLALSLGALLPNFRETNSAKIVSGFGGTLCLVLSFFYIVLSVGILIVPAVQRHALAAKNVVLPEFGQMELASLGMVFILTVFSGGLPYFFAFHRTKRLANLGNP